MQEDRSMETECPVVTIYCLTYNHENYIRDCLEGFVRQKTEFPFEVIIHDDASTDRTAEIVREYAEKYPHIIRPIYQTENQFSLDIDPVKAHVFPRVRGKYVAICEGDDYWTDDEKLQKQISRMEEDPDCHFCVCGVQEVTVNKQPLGVIHPKAGVKGPFMLPETFIQHAGTYSFQTSSYVMRYADWKKYMEHEPAFKLVSDIGDLPMLLYFGSLGKTAYVDRVMSCYRRGAPTSYSAAKNQWSEEKRITHFEKQMNVWKLFDEFSGERFHNTCVKKVSDHMFGYCILQYRARDYLGAQNREYFGSLSNAKKTYVLLACVFQKLMKKHYMSNMIKKENKELSVWESVQNGA